MKSRYITGKELIENKYLTLREITELCESGELQAYTQDGDRVINLICFSNDLDSKEEQYITEKTEEIISQELKDKTKYNYFCQVLTHYNKKLPEERLCEMFHNMLRISIPAILRERNIKQGDYPFPFDTYSAIKLGYSEFHIKKYIESFLFLRSDVENICNLTCAKNNIGLPAIVIKMLNDGNNPSEVAKFLKEKGLSFSIIGALLHEDGFNPDGRFTANKQCTDFYQKKAQALLKGNPACKA